MRDKKLEQLKETWDLFGGQVNPDNMKRPENIEPEEEGEGEAEGQSQKETRPQDRKDNKEEN